MLISDSLPSMGRVHVFTSGCISEASPCAVNRMELWPPTIHSGWLPVCSASTAFSMACARASLGCVRKDCPILVCPKNRERLSWPARFAELIRDPGNHLSVDDYLPHRVLKRARAVGSVNDAKDPGFGVIPNIRADPVSLPFCCRYTPVSFRSKVMIL